jgi:hypothetical protein
VKPSGRIIIDKPGAEPRIVQVDETGKTANDAAHSYDDALAAGRRFKARQALGTEQRALLETLKPAQQNDLLDVAPSERAKIFADMKAASTKKAAPAAETKPGDGK